MPRPLAPLPIALWSAAAAAILWSSDLLDDFVGAAVIVALALVLVWIGMRGDADDVPTPGQRVALAIGGALPSGACWLALTPWVARGDGMASLGVVVMMLMFGVPLGIAAVAVGLYLGTQRPRIAALARVLAISAGFVVVAWALALA